MSAYTTIVVGTDGSDRSMRAVERAAAIAGDADATLVLVCAYHAADKREIGAATDALGNEAYLVVGSAPADSSLRQASELARRKGASNIKTVAVQGDAETVLTNTVNDTGADLLVVGNRGLNSIAGRLLGSVPAAVARHAGCDVMIVRTES